MFEKINLKWKLILSFGVLVVFVVLIGTIGFLGIKKTSEKYDHVAKINLGNAMALSDMNLWSTQITSDIRGYGIKAAAGGMSSDETKKWRNAFDNDIQKYQAADTLYISIDFVEGEEALYKNADTKWKRQLALV